MKASFHPLFAVLAVFFTQVARAEFADVHGLWGFDTGNFASSVAGAGSLTVVGSTSVSFASDTVGGDPAAVLSVPAFEPGQWLAMPTGSGGHGGGIHLNQWSLVMDVKVNSAALPTYTALLQTQNGGNTDDAEWFITSEGKLRILGASSATGAIAAQQWNRIAITCGNDGLGGLVIVRGYINGVKVFESTPQPLDGAYALEPVALLFADNNFETAPTLCNSIAFWRETLSEADLAFLGGPTAAGIPTWVAVSSTADSGPSSLRQALITAAARPGADTIVFAAALNASAISLASEITIADADGVTIDATSLSAGLTINDGVGSSYRLFEVSSGSKATLRGLTLINGGGKGFSGDGGAIHNAGTLTLERCVLAHNSASSGGAISSDLGSALTLTRCTLSQNSALGHAGGAISTRGTTTLVQCTLAGNSSIDGGAIGVFGTLGLTQCTLAGNTAQTAGSAIAHFDGYHSATTLANCIIAGNIYNDGGTVRRVSANIIEAITNINGGTDSGRAAIVADPLLAPLGNYGGTMQTMALKPGSPARNAAIAVSEEQRLALIPGTPAFRLTFNGASTNLLSATTTSQQLENALNALPTIGGVGRVDVDSILPFHAIGYSILFGAEFAGTNQPSLLATSGSGAPTPIVTTFRDGGPPSSDERGFPIIGVTDIGAYEAGTFTVFDAWIWETLPDMADAAQHAAAFDYDGDGATNYNEWLALTNPVDPASSLLIAQLVRTGALLQFLDVTFPTVVGRTYRLESSIDLATWTFVPSSDRAGTGSPVTVQIGPMDDIPKFFVRVAAGP